MDYDEPSVMSSTSPLSPKHLRGVTSAAGTDATGSEAARERGRATYWVNFHVGEFASLSTILVGSDSERRC